MEERLPLPDTISPLCHSTSCSSETEFAARSSIVAGVAQEIEAGAQAKRALGE